MKPNLTFNTALFPHPVEQISGAILGSNFREEIFFLLFSIILTEMKNLTSKIS